METRNRDILFKGLVVNIEQMEVKVGEKGWYPFQIVRHSGGVGVLPLHEDGTVTLIRQLRPSVGEFLLEIPAGRLDPGEFPVECGLRELAEETGLVPEKMDSLGYLNPTPGFCDERIYLFLARGLEQRESAQEAYEEIEAVRVPLQRAVEMAISGEINDGKTLAALFRAQAVLG